MTSGIGVASVCKGSFHGSGFSITFVIRLFSRWRTCSFPHRFISAFLHSHAGAIPLMDTNLNVTHGVTFIMFIEF
jgi:hypothetical protein